MRYRDRSFDELEELEQELHMKDASDLQCLNFTKIDIYDAMLTHLSILCKSDEDYVDYYTYIKNKLICHLLRYESNINASLANERLRAEQTLKNIRIYDQKNPIASYRLGCLLYLQKKFNEAASYFQYALDFQKDCNNKLFLLNTMQINRAVLYISNCSLHSGCQALVFTSEKGAQEPLLNASFSNYFAQLSSNEELLKLKAYRKVTMDGVEFTSGKGAVETLDLSPKNTLMLFFIEDEAELFYNGIKETLTAPQAHVLRRLLLDAHLNTVTPLCLKDYFLDSHVVSGASQKALQPLMAQLKKVLAELETQVSIHESDEGYQLIGSMEYILMDRIDEQLAD